MKTKERLIVTATELKQNFGKYMALVEQQEDVVITKNGTKVARLTPYITDLEQYYQLQEKALEYQYEGQKVSYDEFMEIYQKSELRLEFINGEIHVLASPSVTHQGLLGRFHLLFHAYFSGKKCQVFFAPFDVHFWKKDIEVPDVMQPDLLVICDLEDNVTDNDRYTGTPTLVVEILSKSTRSKDMIDKLNTYRLSGVEEYWIIDPRQETILVYSFKDHEIDDYKIYGKEDTAQSQCFPGLECDVASVFAQLT